MTIYDDVFPLGFGTNRFSISGVNDEIGIERAVQLVLTALEAGVNYIDVAHSYSRGMAHDVLCKALKSTKRPYHVTLKSKLGIDDTADCVRRHAEASLANMGIDRASFFVCWSIMNFAEFEQITTKGGMYDGIQKLKAEGIINHICFSTHALPVDIVKIMQSGMFEGVTISYSLLNSTLFQPVLDYAKENDIGVVAMNPLGGGVIPQNRKFFSFANMPDEDNTVQAALKFVLAQPAIQVVLSGVSSIAELDENLKAVTPTSIKQDAKRISYVNTKMISIKGFCTGCRYCAGCPKDIPIPAFMQSNNCSLFEPVITYHRNDPGLLHNIELFRRLENEFSVSIEVDENPCIRCGQCEAKCTQKLPIIDTLDDIFKRVKKTRYALDARKQCLQSLLKDKNYNKVGFYPGGGYTSKVISLYFDFFGEPSFECILFDSNPKSWGTKVQGLTIHAPDTILDLHPDVIVVSNYNYSDEIYENIKHFTDDGIRIMKLHQDDDVPWIF